MRILQIAAAAAFAVAMSAASAQAASTGTSELEPAEVQAELKRAQASIDDMEYQTAIDILSEVVASNPRVADAYNLLGYSQRKLERYEEAERNYQRALRLDPDHLGALEYVGELYIETGRREEAEAMLIRLQEACPNGCNELEDLKAALAGQKTTSNW